MLGRQDFAVRNLWALGTFSWTKALAIDKMIRQLSGWNPGLGFRGLWYTDCLNRIVRLLVAHQNVLSALGKFKLSTGNERTMYKPWTSLGFYSSRKPKIEQLLNGYHFWSDFITCWTAHFFRLSHLWTSVVGIEIPVLYGEESSLLSWLHCCSLQQHIFLAFCNNLESHCIICARILFSGGNNLILFLE